MSNLYKVTLKLGKSSYSTQFYSNSVENVLTFCQNNLYPKVMKIEEVLYEALESTVIPVDDPSQYQNTFYFSVRNETDNKVSQIVTKCVKNTRTTDEVLADIKSLLKLDKVSSVTSSLLVNQSSK